MLSKVTAFALSGLEGCPVQVDTDISGGFFKTDIVGMGDIAVKEAKDRVLSAIENSGYSYPGGKVLVSLAPANLKKEGSGFDLAIAVGILCASKVMRSEGDTVYVGELALSGELRGVLGILPLLISAREKGYKKFVLPLCCEKEASYVGGVETYAAATLKDVVSGNLKKIQKSSYQSGLVEGDDFQYVKGQPLAKRGIEIAVSGGHNILMIGSPGSGKTMLAKCIPSIMPPMDFDEALEVTKIHSVCGILEGGIVSKRPFRSPHHTASTVALTGGGRNSMPGEFSLSHNGVLFLDEMPEYTRHTLETLRQPLEDGVITVSRASGSAVYPCSFMLVGSMNPCPCGNFGSGKKPCKCTRREIEKYLNRLSSPLLDRIDLHVEVDEVAYEDLQKSKPEESSKEILQRVLAARDIQKRRQNQCNDRLAGKQLQEFCALDEDCQNVLQMAFERLKLSARAYTRVIKVARTIADLQAQERIQKSHILEAVQFRALDRKYFG